MTAAATSRAAPRTPWSSGSPSASSAASRARHKQQQQQQQSQPSTTPHGFPPGRSPGPLPPSVGQTAPPRLSPHGSRSSRAGPDPRSTSPGYFGLAVENGSGSQVDSEVGQHTRANWKTASSSVGSKAATSPQPIPHDQNPDFSDFRKQSEAYAMNLENLHRFSSASQPPSSPLATAPVRSESDGFFSSPPHILGRTQRSPDQMDVDGEESAADTDSGDKAAEVGEKEQDKVRERGRRRPPALHLTQIDEKDHRLSLPQKRVEHAIRGESKTNSMPQLPNRDGPLIIDPADVVQLFQAADSDRYLLLDLRVSPQYTSSHIAGALNLCIPTTLLKRPSFNVQRLSDSFTTQAEKELFSRWKQADHIIVYDANSATLRDAASSINTLKKFSSDGWKGAACVIRGGFQAFAEQFPDHVERDGQRKDDGKRTGLSIQAGSDSVKVAGGCPMPAQKTAANPFFGNIRQNMDLIGGVGQVALTLPDAVGPRTFHYLPQWLQDAASVEDEGKQVAEKFLKIEKAEQKRMQDALNQDVSYGTPLFKSDKFRIAGIEKGYKNRYKDMLPYDHARVRLQDVPKEGCDYINASHVKAEWSNRHYIATQAPVPATFEDFWRVVWEQDVRVIVMLTAETEGGQQKCHPYWVPDAYGAMKVRTLSEKRVALAPPSTLAAKKRAQLDSLSVGTTPVQARKRGVTNPLGLSQAAQDAALEKNATGPGNSGTPAEVPHALVRQISLSHASFPFQPMREITQLQFTQWPDFGAISARDVLGLVEQTNAAARVVNGASASAAQPERDGERPILVHCSAGCGRTGTFCAIDSTIDMLKRQRMAARSRAAAADGEDATGDGMDVDGEGEDGWLQRDDVDLVAKTVEDFRLQRLSMVQNLKQFALCYEAVMEWIVKETPERFRKEHARRSLQG